MEFDAGKHKEHSEQMRAIVFTLLAAFSPSDRVLLPRSTAHCDLNLASSLLQQSLRGTVQRHCFQDLEALKFGYFGHPHAPVLTRSSLVMATA